MTAYIVKLECGVWLAPWSGDPGRTTQRKLAKRFSNKWAANAALARAQSYRPFEQAAVVAAELTLTVPDDAVVSMVSD